MTDEQVESVIEVQVAELDTVRVLASKHGVQVQPIDQEGLEPVSTVVVALWGTSLAVATVVYLLDKRKGGQVIDLRPRQEAILPNQ